MALDMGELKRIFTERWVIGVSRCHRRSFGLKCMAEVLEGNVMMRMMLIYMFVEDFIGGNGSDSFYEVES